MQSVLDDKSAYCERQLLRAMCRGERYACGRLGEPEELDKIDVRTLWAHDKSVLASSRVELFYLGSKSVGEAEALLQPLLAHLPRTACVPVGTNPGPQPQALRRFSEVMPLAQSRISLGFRTDVTLRSAQYPATLEKQTSRFPVPTEPVRDITAVRAIFPLLVSITLECLSAIGTGQKIHRVFCHLVPMSRPPCHPARVGTKLLRFAFLRAADRPPAMFADASIFQRAVRQPAPPAIRLHRIYRKRQRFRDLGVSLPTGPHLKDTFFLFAQHFRLRISRSTPRQARRSSPGRPFRPRQAHALADSVSLCFGSR